MNETLSDIWARRKQITCNMANAAKCANRQDEPITLVAVSKRQSEERIQMAWDAGQRVFGENLVQEAQRHWAQKRENGDEFTLHLIGYLQSNKAKIAVDLFDVIETLSTIKLAKALQKAIQASQRNPQIYIQINTGEEPQKHGVLPKELPAFLARLKKETDLQPVGLMCIPPEEDEPGLHFALLAKLARQYHFTRLSMGMSRDYETAIRFGATSVRIGVGFFGERNS